MAAPTLQQKKVNWLTSAGTSCATTFDSTPATGALIVAFAYCSTNYSGLSISDDQGNTYTNRTGNGYADAWGRIYTAVASTPPSTVTVSLTSGLAVLAICEVRGFDGTSVYEKLGNHWQTISSANSPYSPLNFSATTNAEQLFLACLGISVTSGTVGWAAGSGWTGESSVTDTTGKMGHVLLSKAVTSTGTYDPEWTAATGGNRNTVTLGISVLSGNDGNPSGSSLAGSAVALSAGSMPLTIAIPL